MRKQVLLAMAILVMQHVRSQNSFPATGNVAIGTTSANALLSVGAGSSVPSNTHLWITGGKTLRFGSIDGDGGYGSYLKPNLDAGGYGMLTFGARTAGSDYDLLTINGNNGGNVGIGTTTPRSKLWLQNTVSAGADNYTLTLVNTTTAADSRSGMRFWVNEANTGGAAISVANDNAGGGNIRFHTITSESTRMSILASNGNVGIGTTNPGSRLWLQNAVSAGSDNYMLNLENPTTVGDARSGIRFWVNSENSAGATINVSNDNASGGNIRFNTITAGTESTRVSILSSNGNMGIGTVSPTEKLSVNGNIIARKIRITQTGWSDYVFDKDYQLRPIASLESFISRNKHLPDMPSAKEVEANGISVGDTQALLLKKIEELSLYIIDLNKRIQSLEKEKK
jgi:hypothetical protein